MTNSFKINYVALYLRKSRGEEDKDLENHRFVLVELCKKNNWKYVEYVEIANSETIKYRPKFKQLLKDVEEGLYDAVLVVDYQRLGRGEVEEQGIIKRVFRDSKTYIVTPEKIYNLVDDTDDLLVDVKGLLARQEYKTITKNLIRGKKIGARRGRWTNGTPPFPYVYEPSIKGLLVDEVNNKIYQEMKRMVLDGIPCYEVAWYLNNRGILSPRGSVWHENTVRRLMIDETHLGRIISNKTEGSGHKNKKTKPLRHLPREEWVIVENCHDAVKTLEEHEQILALFARRKIIPHRARSGSFLLSGLVFCGKCGKRMQFVRKPNGTVSVKPCQASSPYGAKCGNRGIKVDVLTEAINYKLEEYESQLLKHENYSDKEEIKRTLKILNFKQSEKAKLQKALIRIKELYEIGDYNRDEYHERKNARSREIQLLDDEITGFEAKINFLERRTTEEKITNIKDFKEIWNSSADSKTKNTIAKQVISAIVYTRDHEDSVNIKVSFL